MEKCVIKNPDVVRDKIEKMKRDGVEKLHIISDYDRTITKAPKDKNSSAYAKLAEVFGEEFKKKDQELFDHYYPIEISTELPFEEKIKAMNDWWKIHYKLVMDAGMTKDKIDYLVNLDFDVLRDYVGYFFKIADDYMIPLLIFSAGIGNFIDGNLKKEDLWTDNLILISNFFFFDNEGKCTGHSEEFITSLGKREFSIKNEKYLKIIEEKPNVILLGDFKEDVHMSQGIDHNCVLKIGFLRDDTKDQLEIYEDIYDIVVLDGTFEKPLKILKEIIS